MSVRPVHNRPADDRAEAAAEPEHHAGHGRRTINTHPHPPHERRSAERPRGDDRATGSPATRRAEGGAFTFGHAGRQVRLGPVAFWTVVGTLVIMAGWSVVTATYFAFQDDVLARMAARQAAMQYAYEDRLAEMRAQVDRATSRQLLDQEQLEQKLDQIVRRQAVLEGRATTLGSMADPAVTGAIRPGARLAPPAPAGTPKALPMSGPALFAAPAMREAKFDPNWLANPGRAARPRVNIRTVLARLAESLDRVEGRQTMRSLPSKNASTPRRGRFAPCSPTPASTPSKPPIRASADRSSPTACRRTPAPSSSRSIASMSRAPRPNV